MLQSSTTSICIEGPIGVGKSEFLKQLRTFFLKSLTNMDTFAKPLHFWENFCCGGQKLNALKHYYKDSSFIFPFQVLATTRYACEANKCQTNCGLENRYWISERNILMPGRIFVKMQWELGNLNIEQAAINEYLINTFIDLHPELIRFDYMIYLKTPPDICFYRIQKKKKNWRI